VFLVVFALLGFAGGVRTMLRTADEVQRGRGEAARMRPDRRVEDGEGPDGD
jgi:F0F1-type ATP synthase assembly protein I